MNAPQSSTKRTHPIHVGHLVMGLAFLGLVAIWAGVEYDVVPTDDVRWLLPLPWVFAGVAGLLATTLSGRGRKPVTATGWVTQPTPMTAEENETETEVDAPADHGFSTDNPTENEEIR